MFELEIHTDNAAFEDDPVPEVVRILDGVIASLERGIGREGKYQTVHDINGNDVGRFRLSVGE